MERTASWLRMILPAFAAACLVSLSACGGTGTPIPPPPPPLKVATTSLPAGLLGTAYTQTLTATGGIQPYSWAVTTGSLPSGLSLNASTGLISGTLGGVFARPVSFTATVTDSQSPVAKATASLSITSTSPIQHIVIIFQENRTPDNLFQDPVLIAPPRNADIRNYGVNSKGQTIQLSQLDLGTNGSAPDNYDISHAHLAFTQMCDLDAATGACQMDGADLIETCTPGKNGCPQNPQFQYVNPADVQPYFQMAEQYTFGDRMFQTNQGPSFPSHQFIISGTSAPAEGSTSFVAENAQGVAMSGVDTGCTAPAAEYVYLIDPSGNETTKMFPCSEHNTLLDFLDQASITWRYYTPSAGSLWTGPNAIQHICMPSAPTGGVCQGPDWTGTAPKVVLDQTQVLTDIANNQLPQVSWVIPDGAESDHAFSNDGSGPSWVASVVNAIGGNSNYWPNTAIILTWDDWGGWYDHVSPPILNSYEYGFRVPLLVISPYAKLAYTSHVTHDFGSILKFIEETFNLPSLGYADAPADDFADCFNFSQTPTTFTTIAAPLKAEFFLNDTRPRTDPDDD